MILAQSNRPIRPLRPKSAYGVFFLLRQCQAATTGRSKLPLPGSPPVHRASSPVVKRRHHPSTSSAPHFTSPPFLLRAETGAIKGRRLTSRRSSSSCLLRPYRSIATPPANSTALILAPLSSPPLPERLAHRAPPPSFAPHHR
jgi:hypothetical protein